jgi:glycosyltransferase involved in cell wall biosynthesis
MSFALTVIIPSYNNASFLERCIGSISAPESSVEIIVVDDGSTDDTVRVLAGLKDRLSNLKVISQANGGVSCARNAGLREASGRFVTFLDADDLFFPGALNPILNQTGEYDSDIVIFRNYCKEVEHYQWEGIFKEKQLYSGADLMQKSYIRGSVCGCFFKLDFLKDHGVIFCTDLSLAEDTVFFACAISAGAKVSFYDHKLYEIVPRESSASRRLDATFLERYGRALHATRRLVADRCIADNTMIPILMGIVNVAAPMGYSAKDTYRICDIGSILPLSVPDVYAHKWLIWLLNRSFRIFFWIKKYKDRFLSFRRG